MRIAIACVLTIVLLLPLSSHLRADELHLKNGYIYKNGLVRDTVNNYVTFTNKGDLLHFALSGVMGVIKSPVDTTIGISVISPEWKTPEWNDRARVAGSMDSTARTFPNLRLLPITVICGFVAWDYIKQASQIQDLIDKGGRDLESDRNRKSIVAGVLVIAGIANAIISLESVEVQAASDKITVAYKF